MTTTRMSLLGGVVPPTCATPAASIRNNSNTSMEVHPPSSASSSKYYSLYDRRNRTPVPRAKTSPSTSNSSIRGSNNDTQAMRNDLEGLIEYIDGLAFQLSPTTTTAAATTDGAQRKERQEPTLPPPPPPPPRQQFVNENSGSNDRSSRNNKPVFRDRSNGNNDDDGFVERKMNSTTKGGDGGRVTSSRTGGSKIHNYTKTSSLQHYNYNNTVPDLTMLISTNANSRTKRMTSMAAANENREGDDGDEDYQNNDSRYLYQYENQQDQYQSRNNGQLSLDPPTIGKFPPTHSHHDSSLYLQGDDNDDDVLSLILSRSSVADDDVGCVQEEAVGGKGQHYVHRLELPIDDDNSSTNNNRNNAPTPRILAQVEGRLSKIGTSMTVMTQQPSRNSNQFGFHQSTSTKNNNDLRPIHGHHQRRSHHHHNQSPPGTHISRSSSLSPQPSPPPPASSRNVEPLMDRNRVPSHTKSIASTWKNSSSSPPAARHITAAATPKSFRGDRKTFTGSNSSRLDPTPIHHHKKLTSVNSTLSPIGGVRDSFDGFLRLSNISTPNNVRRRDDMDNKDEPGLLLDGGSRPTLSVAVDATPRIDGKVSRHLISSEDPDGYDRKLQEHWTMTAGDPPQEGFDANYSSASSSSSSGIMRNIDKYTLYQDDTPETQTQFQNFDTSTPAHRPQRHSSETLSPPESARKLLKDAVQAVQEARNERQSARRWADEVKNEVSRWVSEQRELIRTESLATNSPTSAVTTSSCLMQLEQTIQNLHQDLARSNSSREHSDRMLEQLLLDQGEQIQTISAQLETLRAKLNNNVTDSQSVMNARTTKLQNKPDVSVRTTTAKTPSVLSRNVCGIPPFIDRTPKVNSADALRGITSTINTPGRSILTATTHSSCNSHRTRRRTPNGGYITEYSNGSIKEVHPDGTTVTRFANGDVETKFRSFITSPPQGKLSTPSSMSVQASPRGIVAYFYSKDAILQISQNDGSKLFEYPNGQVEKHYPDGFKMILYSDGTKQGVTRDGQVIEYSK